VFFGLGGLAGLYSTLSRSWSFALTHDGIEVNGNNFGYKVTLIPWDDVDLIGIATIHRREAVGIRLSSYDRYLASRGATASNDYGVWPLVWLIRVTRLISATAVAGRAARPGAGGGPALESWLGARDIAGILRGNRAACGYDIVFGWSSLDRAPRAMVQAIEDYRRGALFCVAVDRKLDSNV
jgi:hypothetical protein